MVPREWMNKRRWVLILATELLIAWIPNSRCLYFLEQRSTRPEVAIRFWHIPLRPLEVARSYTCLGSRICNSFCVTERPSQANPFFLRLWFRSLRLEFRAFPLASVQELDTRYFLTVSVSGLNDSVQVVLTVHRIPSCILAKHLNVLLVYEKELCVLIESR